LLLLRVLPQALVQHNPHLPLRQRSRARWMALLLLPPSLHYEVRVE
jgi:hypothetical protein